MKKTWSQLVATYQNSKLNVKLFIRITLLMVVTLALVLLGLQYAFSLYDEQIYAKSSQVLMMSSNSIEEQLEQVEEASFNIAVDPQIQSALQELQGNVTHYDMYRLEQKLEEELASYVSSEKYIHSIYIYDSSGREFLAGSSSKPLGEKEKRLALYQADQYEGKNYWMEMDGVNEFLTSVRLLRSYENLNFEKLGKLVIRVNLDKIVTGLPLTQGEAGGNIIISNSTQVFYSQKDMDGLTDYNFQSKNGQGYGIEKINGERFFVNHIATNFEDWTYWNIIPFNAMFSKITVVKYSMVLIFSLLFMLLISIGFEFLKRITNPIEGLATTMQQVQKGDFMAVQALKVDEMPVDEVGTLYRNFKTMVQRIDELIKENFSKQLLVKETEFKALQAQINPHFLYNTLESVNWLAKTNKQQQISSMVEALGHLMRNSINFNEDIITVEKELEIVQSYLTIQHYRFGDRLAFQMDIPATVMHVSIPKLTLQPLLENSFQHAVEPSLEMSIIKLKAEIIDTYLHIRVEDNGPGIDPNTLQYIKKGIIKPKGTGIGLNNIDTRIKLGFGEQYGLQIENLDEKGTAVTVILPITKGC